MNKTDEDYGVKLIVAVTNVLIGGAIGLAVCLVFLLLFSVGISAGHISESYIYQLTLAAVIFGALAGGKLAAVRNRTRRLLTGLGAGLVLFLLTLTIGLCLSGAPSFNEHRLGLLTAALLGGALAGIFPRRTTKQKKKRKK